MNRNNFAFGGFLSQYNKSFRNITTMSNGATTITTTYPMQNPVEMQELKAPKSLKYVSFDVGWSQDDVVSILDDYLMLIELPYITVNVTAIYSRDSSFQQGNGYSRRASISTLSYYFHHNYCRTVVPPYASVLYTQFCSQASNPLNSKIVLYVACFPICACMNT